MLIRWQPPEPRRSWLRYWDMFVGPGATSTEEWVQLIGGLVVAVLASVRFFVLMPSASLMPSIVVVLLAPDLGGGIVTNATAAAKRWYHRAEQTRFQHLRFVAVHGVHLALLVWLAPSFTWLHCGLLFGYLLGATWLILRMPLYLQRPVAFICYASGVLFSLWLPMVGLDWVIPLLFLKLLLSYAVKEAPFSPEAESSQ